MYYMIDFGIGNITGTRHFLGDMSKEGKDALIQLNKGKKRWERNAIKVGESYSPKSTTVSGSTSEQIPYKRFGRSRLSPRLADGYLDMYDGLLRPGFDVGPVNNANVRNHDTHHALPIVTGRNSTGIAPSKVGEGIVLNVANSIYSGMSGGNNSDGLVKSVEPLLDIRPDIPFKPSPYTVKPLDNFTSDLVSTPLNLAVNSKSGKPRSATAQKQVLGYVNDLIADVDSNPALKEALQANEYLGARTRAIVTDNKPGIARPFRTSAARTLNEVLPASKKINMDNIHEFAFGLRSPFPNIDLSNAPPGSLPLVLGSQLGTGVGGLLGVERSLEEGMDEEGNLTNPLKALAKSAVYVPGGATVGTLTGLSGGVLLNRMKGNNNLDALRYTSNQVFNN